MEPPINDGVAPLGGEGEGGGGRTQVNPIKGG